MRPLTVAGCSRRISQTMPEEHLPRLSPSDRVLKRAQYGAFTFLCTDVVLFGPHSLGLKRGGVQFRATSARLPTLRARVL